MSPGAVPALGVNAVRESYMATAAISAIAAAVPTWYGLTKPLLDPTVLRGDCLMQLLVLEDKLPELEARLEGGLDEESLHVRLPVVRVEDLLEHVRPEALLPRREAGRAHDRAHDVVIVDREPL